MNLPTAIIRTWQGMNIPDETSLTITLEEYPNAVQFIVGRTIDQIDWRGLGYSYCDFILETVNLMQVFYSGALAYYLATRPESSNVRDRIESCLSTLLGQEDFCSLLSDGQKACFDELVRWEEVQGLSLLAERGNLVAPQE